MNPLHDSLDLPDLNTVVTRLLAAKRVLVITGAGISADSGLPTYRGIGGLYNDQHTDDGLPIEVALSGEVMEAEPSITWKHLAAIEANCRGAQPNAAHKVIAAMQELVPTTVLTQNIDGFHRQAGSRDLIEIHGDLFELECVHCSHHETVADYSRFKQLPPPCPHCLGHLRPAVVLFGEALPRPAIQRLEKVLQDGFDLVFSIGTTSVFPYIAQPFTAARHFGALAVEINPGDTEVSRHANVRWRCGAAAALERLWQAVSVARHAAHASGAAPLS
ncbi:NAD-dependent protein deacylase [Uliginosibacterium aquaticum]|uniref:protein acetyllysine N-acetyltransferase n=1 Tax=Uliginosibacterium aquaticum TaxID=2731212 RepID=A0ABX2III3_9RHOO|nr:NAD-dependent protein deacylase [Uliginosibacterium aquaticum]NSL56586.1 NAD-dependent protein deacylase [Uliginosibacterium aquaticum]